MLKSSNVLNIKRVTLITVLVYLVLSFGLYFIAGDQFKFKISEKAVEATEGVITIGEVIDGVIIEQTFKMETDILESISILVSTYGRTNTGNIRVVVINTINDDVLIEQEISASSLIDIGSMIIKPQEPIENVKGQTLKLVIESKDSEPGNAISLWYNPYHTDEGMNLYVKGQPITGSLCLTVYSIEKLFFGKYYFYFIGFCGVLLCGYLYYLNRCYNSGKRSRILELLNTLYKYKFLLKQLIARDFKIKYKRSVLGVLWSFLNPLFTMMVQYLVFSTLFKSNIPNFIVYLLVGIIFFNFFTESTSMGLGSIVSNTGLISKVYIPKYIFPLSKVLSSAINLLISMITLILAIIITRVQITSAILLLPFSLLCTIVFCIGMSFILSAAMVYFRDTQFLWSVVSMLWMYATPIFYPETILPSKLMILFKMNPMYHFIRFSRAIILNGKSPEPQAYLFCIIAALVPFMVGAYVFRKVQNGFALKL